MAITIDGKEYDETKLDNNVKNSIVQVQNANNNIVNLQADLLNNQIIAQHHSNFIKENLPADEEGTEEVTEEVTTEETAEAPTETATE
jgi:hypothetical protein